MFNRLINKALHLFEVMRIKTTSKEVYLTFDDGPEGPITDWVLDQLSLYGCKATFFCKGCNVGLYPVQMDRIKREGHAIGNHTFSHIKSFDVASDIYIKDVERANSILKTHLFRPPWGALTLQSYFKLVRRKYKIVYWSLMSGDTDLNNLDLSNNMKRLYADTKPGDVVLFHACKRHEKETRQILPLYLDWLKNEGYNCAILK